MLNQRLCVLRNRVAKAFVLIGLIWGFSNESGAISLGELEATGGSVESLDGTVRFSGWSFEPGDSVLGSFSNLKVHATESGFALSASHGCIINTGASGCVLEHFDGFYGPADEDDLVIDFTIEGLVGDVVGVALEGTSFIGDILTEWSGDPIYPYGPTRATAELNITQDTLLHDRSCSAPGCDGTELFVENSSFAGQTTLSAQLVASVLTQQYFATPDFSDNGLPWGTVAQVNALGVSVVVPEPSALLLVGVGLVGLAVRRTQL